MVCSATTLQVRMFNLLWSSVTRTASECIKLYARHQSETDDWELPLFWEGQFVQRGKPDHKSDEINTPTWMHLYKFVRSVAFWRLCGLVFSIAFACLQGFRFYRILFPSWHLSASLIFDVSAHCPDKVANIYTGSSNDPHFLLILLTILFHAIASSSNIATKTMMSFIPHAAYAILFGVAVANANDLVRSHRVIRCGLLGTLAISHFVPLLVRWRARSSSSAFSSRW